MDRPATCPDLTLVVAAKGACDAGPFRNALRAMGIETRGNIEVIIAHDAPLEPPAEPDMTVQIACPGQRSVFDLWGAALAQARSDHVAILDIHCPPEPGWLDAVSAHLRTQDAGFYGPVDARYSSRDPRIIGYLVEYVQFHPPVARAMPEIPGNNFIFRRALAGSPEALEREGFSKTRLMKQWADQGYPHPARIDAAVVVHQKPFAFTSYCVRRYRHGRCYAAQRVRNKNRTTALRFALMTPALPFVRVARIARHTLRVPGFRGALLRFLPQILVAETAWSWGECVGYLAGDGDCARRLD